MPSFQVELDPTVAEWVEQVSSHLENLADEHLLLEAALTELQDFYQERFRQDAPKGLRRALALLRHIESSIENDVDEMSHLCDRIHTSLEASLLGNKP